MNIYYIVNPEEVNFEDALVWVVEDDLEKAKRLAIQDGFKIYKMDEDGNIKDITFEILIKGE